MAEHSWSRAVQRPYVLVCLTERQWDVVREACYQRGTKRATDLGQKIWDQGGGTVKPISFDNSRWAHVYDGTDYGPGPGDVDDSPEYHAARNDGSGGTDG